MRNRNILPMGLRLNSGIIHTAREADVIEDYEFEYTPGKTE